MNLLRQRVVGCFKCSDLVASRRQAVPGEGSVPSKILFVGLAPGRNGADITGVPFTRDPSGEIFQEMIKLVKLNNYFVTNIVKCNPKDSKGRNRTPSVPEIENCKDYLLDEIKLLNPQIIVPLGKQATEFFCGPIKDMKSVLLSKFPFKECTVIPLYHPSYIVRGSYTKDQYHKDFETLISYI